MKAANLLISNKGQLMIADFGLARSVEKESANQVRILPLHPSSRIPAYCTASAEPHEHCCHPLVSTARGPPQQQAIPRSDRHVGSWVRLSSPLESIDRSLIDAPPLPSCVLAEMFHRAPIFPGSSDVDQLAKIFAYALFLSFHLLPLLTCYFPQPLWLPDRGQHARMGSSSRR